MIVIDSSALVAVLLAEVEHEAFAHVLASSSASIVAAPNVLETMIVATTKIGNGGRSRVDKLLSDNRIDVAAFGAQLLNHATDAHERFGRRSGHPAKLNFGDCMAYALAKSLDAPLLYKGDDFAQTDIRSALG